MLGAVRAPTAGPAGIQGRTRGAVGARHCLGGTLRVGPGTQRVGAGRTVLRLLRSAQAAFNPQSKHGGI